MATKTWRLTVSGLGSSGAPLHDVSVQAENWMTALREGRTKIGEQGGVPTGASCAVAPDGKVTILDPAAQRAYVITSLKGDAAAAPASSVPPPAAAAVSVPAAPAQAVEQQPVPQQPVAAEPPAPVAAPLGPQPGEHATSSVPGQGSKGIGKRTMAYEGPLPFQVPPTSAAPQQAPAPEAPVAQTPAPATLSKPAPARIDQKIDMATAAYVSPAKAGSMPPAVAPVAAPVQAAPSPELINPVNPVFPAAAPLPTAPAPNTTEREQVNTSSTIEVSPEAYIPSQPPPAPAGVSVVGLAPEPSSPGHGIHMQLLSERSDDPTPENPLTYRERTLVVPDGTALNVCEQLIREELSRVQSEIAEIPPGKFINLALFDHVWTKRPQRRPLVTLQWKDWRGDPEISFPPRTPPTMMPPGMSIPPPGARGRRTSAPPAEQDERLANAFEACQDLFFLKSAVEALEFVVRLLRETVPSEAITSALYDINTDEFRVVALDGPGSGEKRGEAIPSNAGIFGAAAASIGTALVVDDVHADSRFDPGADGRIGVEPRNMLMYALVHERRLLGMLQLVNRSGRDYFGRGDVNVVTYIGKQLTEFLHAKRIEEKEIDPNGAAGPVPKGTRGRR